MRLTLILVLAFARPLLAQIEVFERQDYENTRGKFIILLTEHTTTLEKLKTQSIFRSSILQHQFYAYAAHNKLFLKDLYDRGQLQIYFFSDGQGNLKTIVYQLYEYSWADGKATEIFFPLENKERLLLESLLQDFAKALHLGINEIRPSLYTASYAMFNAERKCNPDVKICSLNQLKNEPDKSLIKKIDLTNQKIKVFPQEILLCKNLESLHISDNYLPSIPKQLWKLKKLRILDASQNVLKTNSFHFKRNKNLETLNIQFNDITKLPTKIAKNNALKELVAGNNLLSNVANQRIKKMKSLAVLNLYNCLLPAVPSFIYKQKSLRSIDLYHNQIQDISPKIADLSNLVSLAISNNKILKLPEELSTFKSLKTFYCHHNQLDKIPEMPSQLELLDVGHNQIKELNSENLSKLNTLKNLDISFNQIEEDPKLPQKFETYYNMGNPFNQ